MVDIIPQEKKSIEVPHASSAKACPKCLSAQRTRRIPRPLWMRIFPNSMNMTCGQCGHRFWRIS
jgi:hypothetical protein